MELQDEGAERQEYPKMLYQGGVVRDEAGRPVREPACTTVHDADGEAEARAAGYTDAAGPEDEVDPNANDVQAEEAEAPAGEETTAAAEEAAPVEGEPAADAE